MHDLEITWPEGSARFTPDDSPVLVGRSPDAAVVLTDPSISRDHIRFEWTGSAWQADDRSTHGSFDPIGVRLAPRWTVGLNTTVRLGGVEGVEMAIGLVTTRPPGAPLPGTDAPAPEMPPPAAPPSLADFSAPTAASPPPPSAGAAFDPSSAPPPAGAPSSLTDAPSQPAPFDRPMAPTAFDAPPAPPTTYDPPAANGPGPYDGPAPVDDAPPPSVFDPPAAPSAFDAPPAPPTTFDPSAADGPGPYDGPAPIGFDPPAAPSAFDAPPAPPTSYYPPEASGPGEGDPGAGVLHADAYPGYAPSGHGVEAQAGPPSGPGPAVTELASATAVSDATIKVSVDDQDFTFLPGTDITIGRDPSCLVTLDERHSLASRRHLRISYRDDGWWLEDFSSKGTFVDGRRLTKPYKAEGAFIASLGDDDAGTPLRIITAGTHRTPGRSNVGLIAAIALLAVVAIAALALALRGGGEEADTDTSDAGVDPTATTVSTSASRDTLDPDGLAAAKQSTVLLVSEGGSGSGFFVTDTLIVTNQHVAVLDEVHLVAVSRQPDEPAEIEYEAEVVELHPFLDIAVIEIVRTADGAPLPAGGAGLPVVTLGSSSEITLGDSVYNIGFPSGLGDFSFDDMGELLLPPASTSIGQAANFAIWPGCSNPSQDDLLPIDSPETVGCAPDGDISRGVIISTFASGTGASGSPVFSLDDEVIGVVFAGLIDEANISRAISIDAFSDWLETVVAAQS